MKVASTANGVLFRYETGRAALGPPTKDLVCACYFHRDCVRLFDCRDESAVTVAEMLRALGWVQVSRRHWVCEEAAHDPFFHQPADV